MNLKEWAASQGVSYATARSWYQDGKLPVPARKIGGLILVGGPTGTAAVPDDELVLNAARVLVGLCARIDTSGQAEEMAVAAVAAVAS